MPKLDVRTERFPIAGGFTIARGSKTEAVVVVAELSEDGAAGRGECVPYARYGESVDEVAALIASLADEIAGGLDRAGLQQRLPPGAARNALDCAFWDLEAKRAGRAVHELAGVEAPRPVTTAFTISLGTPEAMADAARRAARPLLKLKLGAPGDAARLKAVRAAAPDAELIVDANEGWTPDDLEQHLAACAEAGIRLVEQPLPAADDAALEHVIRPVPVCADESAHGLDGVDRLVGRYDAINVKLDKTGGLTEALALMEKARLAGLDVMVGCMVATSLAMAPAMLLAGAARYVDLDGPLLLAKDRSPGLLYEGSLVFPPSTELWG